MVADQDQRPQVGKLTGSRSDLRNGGLIMLETRLHSVEDRVSKERDDAMEKARRELRAQRKDYAEGVRPLECVGGGVEKTMHEMGIGLPGIVSKRAEHCPYVQHNDMYSKTYQMSDDWFDGVNGMSLPIADNANPLINPYPTFYPQEIDQHIDSPVMCAREKHDVAARTKATWSCAEADREAILQSIVDGA